MSESARGSALLVGGSEAERDRWVAALAETVPTTAVPDGGAALDRLAGDVEVMLVHADLSDPDPPALVAAAREEGHMFRAALVTARAPTEDVVSQGFDAWLLTPVDADQLAETVEGLLACREYDRAVGALYRVATARAEGEDEDEAVTREEIDEARAAADAALAAVETADREALLANSPASFDAGWE
jgi:CheY-like chemotaxis protein